MTPDVFKQGMAQMTAMWPDRSPAPTTIAVYAEALSHLHDSTFLAAIGRCLRECRFFPVPAEILSRADELLTDAGCLPDAPEVAWNRVRSAIRAFYPGKSSGLPDDLLPIVRQMGGLHNLAMAEGEYEQSRQRKEFIELYSEARRRIVYLTPTALSQPLPGADAPMLANGRRA